MNLKSITILGFEAPASFLFSFIFTHSIIVRLVGVIRSIPIYIGGVACKTCTALYFSTKSTHFIIAKIYLFYYKEVET